MAAAVSSLSLLCIASLLPFLVVVANARIPGVYSGGSWETAHATFYGGSDASGTMGVPFLSVPNLLKHVFDF
ncbi:hypothetical protein V6N13_131354 [Hibiscus sabdariffa]